MYDGELTGDLRARADRPSTTRAGPSPKPGMRSQVPQRGVAGRHQLCDVIARASTPTPAHESAESRTLLSVASPKQPRAFASLKPWYSVQATAQQQRSGRSVWTYLIDSVCFMSPAGRVPSRESAVGLWIPRHHVPDADSDRASLPGTGPAQRPGASQDVPDEGLTQEPSTRRSVSAGDRLVAAQPSVRTGARHTRKEEPQ
jgi:hypothetical protein